MPSKPPGWVRGDTDATLHRSAGRSIHGLMTRACGDWIYVGTPGVDGVDDDLTEDSPPFITGTNSNPPRKVTRFRWLLGGGIEIQLHGTTSPGDEIFQLPVGYYDPDRDVDGSSHDDAGVYKPFYIDGTTGTVIDGPSP